MLKEEQGRHDAEGAAMHGLHLGNVLGAEGGEGVCLQAGGEGQIGIQVPLMKEGREVRRGKGEGEGEEGWEGKLMRQGPPRETSLNHVPLSRGGEEGEGLR